MTSTPLKRKRYSYVTDYFPIKEQTNEESTEQTKMMILTEKIEYAKTKRIKEIGLKDLISTIEMRTGHKCKENDIINIVEKYSGVKNRPKLANSP